MKKKKNPESLPEPEPDDVTEGGVTEDLEIPELDSLPTISLSGEELASVTKSTDDTEDVVVILPEDGDEPDAEQVVERVPVDADQLPVVETVVLEDQPWQSGPTTTDVLEDVPSGNLSSAETFPAMEDVPLVKSNPLAEVETEDPSAGRAEPITDRLPVASPKEDDIKVIDEIADIAADLEHDEPLDEEGREATAPMSRPLVLRSAGSRRIRALAVVSSLAALILVGVFFYPELERLYSRYLGAGGTVVTGTGGGQVQALGGGGGGTAPPPGVNSREQLRAKILLAMQLGLRPDGGKE